MTRYAAMFERLRARGEGAFCAFVMLGDPDPPASARVLIDALLDAVEQFTRRSPASDDRTILIARVR